MPNRDVIGRFPLACPSCSDIRHLKGTATKRTAPLKHTNYYATIKAAHEYVPVAFETLGPIHEEGTSLLCEIGERI